MSASFARTGVLTLVLLLVGAAVGEAQGPPRGQMDRERLEQVIRIRMAELIQDRLQLTEEEGAELGRVMEELHGERRALRQRERALRGRASAWGDGDRTDREEARALLDEMLQLRADEVRLFRAEQERLLELLTPEQLLTFYALRDRMADRLRELRGGRRGPPGSGGPPGGAWRER